MGGRLLPMLANGESDTPNHVSSNDVAQEGRGSRCRVAGVGIRNDFETDGDCEMSWLGVGDSRTVLALESVRCIWFDDNQLLI